MAFFAALLAVALIAVATPIGEQVTCKIQSAVAALTGGSYSCEAAQASNPYQADPSKVVKSTVENASSTDAGVTIKKLGPGDLSVDLNDSKGVTKTTYLDGSGARTLTSTQKLSGSYKVEVKSGADKKDGKSSEKSDGGSGLSAKVSASGGISLGRTTARTHKCDAPGQPACSEFDKDNAEAMDDHLRNQGAGRISHGGKDINDEVDGTSVAHQVKLSLGVEASAEAGVGGEKDPLTGDKTPRASASASLKIGGEASYTHIESTSATDSGEKKSTSHEFAYKGEASAAASAKVSGTNEAFGLEDGVEDSDSYAGKYKVTYDENGDLQTITFTNVKEGAAKSSAEVKAGGGDDNAKVGADGKSIVTSTVETTLDVSTLSPEQKEIAEDYVNSSFSNGALTVPQSALNPSRPSSDPFDNLLYEKAQVTRTQQQGAQVTDAGGINVAIFDWRIFHWNEVQSQTAKETLSVEQLGRPSGPGGERRYEEVEVP